jgi:hypothetical protein
VKPRREPWVAFFIPERVAALLELTPAKWGELEHFGLADRGRGRVLSGQASRPTLERGLDRCRYLRGWRREGVLVLPPGDRVQVERTIDRLEESLRRHYHRQETPV